MSRLLACVVALTACTGGRYSARVDCEETFACCAELGTPVKEFTVRDCIDTTEVVVDQLSQAERDNLDAIFDFCRSEGSTGCAFQECVSGAPVTECPAIFLTGED